VINSTQEVKLVENIKEQLQLTNCEMASILGMSESNLLEVLNNSRNLKFKDISHLSEKLNVDIDLLRQNQVDFKKVKSFLKIKKSTLCEKYTSIAPYSKTQSVKSIIDYIKFNFRNSDPLLNSFYKSFQLDRDCLVKNQQVSLQFIVDTTEYLKKYIDLDYYKVGQFSCINLASNSFIKKVEQYQSRPIHQLYEYFFLDLIAHFEENFDYQISTITHKELYFSVKAKELLREAYKKNLIDNRYICSYRTGVISALPALFGNSFKEVVKLNNVTEKDAAYKYKVIFQ
jgi:transcriptional regulator with XRE-family HTH domain